jgi:hypothetical protein
MEQERWLPVVGFEGLYEVSSLGLVRSLPRVVPHRTGGRLALPGRILTGSRRATRMYPMVNLWRDNRQHARYVHALVLEAFVGPRPHGCDACHFDGCVTNNRADNLRWDTRKANMADAMRHGTTTKGWNWRMGPYEQRRAA